MGRQPPHEYTTEPRGGREQIMEKLPQNSAQPDTIAISNSNVNDNIELSALNGPSKEELDQMIAARNSKSYFVFASLMTVLGLIFSLVSMLSCSFGIVHWAVDGNSAAYQSDITHLGLFRWYNPKTSSCWSYAPDDTEFFYVDGAARGLSAAAVVFGGCATWMVTVISIANLACCIKKGGCCARFNLNSTSHSTTFFTLSGLTFLSSILQICTLTYFNQGNVPDYTITCNANEDSNCTMGVGAHYGIIAFIMYLVACFVYAMAGVGCRIVEAANGGRGGDVEDNLPPPPPPPFPPTTQQQRHVEEDLGSLDTNEEPKQADDDSGPPPPAPNNAPPMFAAFGDDDEMQSV
mmetsp:Transcript_11287/g.17019  ORF Transcript_11287/g.17019 Transcript_11287/m.17019 type:complete len:349 (+) Transcript_11287:181-1227(+)